MIMTLTCNFASIAFETKQTNKIFKTGEIPSSFFPNKSNKRWP